ncbi:MAG: hypothetical protein N2Z71_03960, partial [Caloramator sp.]|nr:hypothetical protein [Caloramator sp.]
AILGILLSIAYINFTKSIVDSRLDSVANEVASMLRDVYENGNKSMDYEGHYLKINKNNGIYTIELINKKDGIEKVARSAEYKDVNIYFCYYIIEENGNEKIVSTFDVNELNFIFFTSEGELKVKYSLSDDGQEINLIQFKNKSESNTKKVYIDKIPAGNIRVE